MSDQRLQSEFPNLGNDGYEITSPETRDYNCIAWAAGDDSRWWWPDASGSGFWPPGVPRSETVFAFIQAYASLGYAACDSFEVEPGWEKVALYQSPTGQPTHAARQLPNGKWTSKCGKLEDIEHASVHRIEGRDYGIVAVVLKRRRKP